MKQSISQPKLFSTKKITSIFLFITLLIVGFTFYTAKEVSAAACTAPSTDYGKATATVGVGSSATYRIWSRMYAPDTTNNSYLLEVDGNTCFVVGDNNFSVNNWTWVDYQNGNPASKVQMALSAGNHTIKMIGREPSVKLGRVLLVSDLNCIPTGNGDNCAVAPKDAEAPSVNITAPAAGATVKGVINITASAKDNVGVTKVEFYINGSLKAADTNAPYDYTWDSRITANGKVNLMTRAYDAAGNVNSDSLIVTVAGGDTQAPSAPTNLTAQVEAANKIVVKWSASTDNIGIAGYRITRNKVSVGQVGAETQYTDSAVLPSTSYAYQVVAYDAAGNVSGLSNEVTVKTPYQADPEAPSTPTNLQAKTVSNHQINLVWSASTDNIAVAGYDIFRSSGKGVAVKVATVSNTSYGDTGLTPKTKYSYYVVAKDKAGNAGGKSAVVSSETLSQSPASGYGAIRGQVSFPKRTDIHARVITHVNGVKHSYDTDQNGNYMISNLPPGTYKVTYRANGSQSKELTLRVTAGKIKVQNITLEKR